MTSVTILHEAEIELWQAVEFYESKCVGLGLDFETEIKAAVELIQQSPDRWPIRNDGTRWYLVRRFSVFHSLHQPERSRLGRCLRALPQKTRILVPTCQKDRCRARIG